MGMKEIVLPVCRIRDLQAHPPEFPWLIHSLWGSCAVGIIGGPPKSCKSWLGLDMAVSVASSTPCLGRFTVHRPGPCLIFMAEDELSAVRNRIESLCAYRGLDIDRLDLYVITSPLLRLDLDQDQKRFEATLAQVRPQLVLLDPLVRIHQLDENSSADISKFLGFIRKMQRTYQTAVILVHHTGKKYRNHIGQSLRGSSDLHAFGDSNGYLTQGHHRLVLTLEHRSAHAIDPLELKLVSKDDTPVHLEVVSPRRTAESNKLSKRILTLLQVESPLTRDSIRKQLKVNNQRLGLALTDLEKQALIIHSKKGWLPVPQNLEFQDKGA